jgi:two-component system sensor histidine kinase RpfC
MTWWTSIESMDSASVETQQAKVRLLVVIFGFVSMLSLSAISNVIDSSRFLSLWAAYAIFAYLWLILVTCSPVANPTRRVLSLVADMAILSALLHAAPSLLGPLYIAYLGVEIDYGFRYGDFYGMIAMGVAASAFGMVIVTTPFWETGWLFSWGLLLGLVLLPLYISIQLSRIRAHKSALDRSNQIRTEFMANMSHGLRTPVNTIVGLIAILQNLEVTGENRHYLETLRMAAKELEKEADQALNWFRLEAGSVALFNESFDLYKVMTECVQLLRPQADAKGLPLRLRIDPHVPYSVEGDSHRLGQILMNLVSNAIKFTHQGFVEIRLTLLEHRLDQATICVVVKDTGIGIPEPRKRLILEPYYQADAATERDYGGSGLGTAIARKTAEAMGGELWFQSVQGQGTMFWVKLPFRVLTAPGNNPRVQPLAVLAITPDSRQDWLIPLRSWVDRLDIAAMWPPQREDYDLIFVEASVRVNPAWRPLERVGITGAIPIYVVIANDADPLDHDDTGITIHYTQDQAALYRALHARDLWKQVCDTPMANTVTRPARTARILVAEDNAPHQLILRRLLEQAGHQVTVVGTGIDALEALRTASYDLAIFDAQMPRLGGLEALRRYRAERHPASVPVIAISADIAPESARCFQEAGAAHYLTKPLKPDMLLWLVSHALDQTATAGDVNTNPMPEKSTASRGRAGSLSVLDKAHLAELKAHKKPGFMTALIASVRRTSDQALADLEHARASLDQAACRRALHALANAAAAVGAAALCQLCHETRLAIDQARLSLDDSDWLKQIQQAHDTLGTALEQEAGPR